jgi:hypothetical protein
MAEPTKTEVPVNFTNWVEILKNGPVFINREQPRPVGGVDGKGYGPDVQPSGNGPTYFPEGM